MRRLTTPCVLVFAALSAMPVVAQTAASTNIAEIGRILLKETDRSRIAKALSRIEAAAAKGDTRAMMVLARYLLSGKGGKADPVRALDLLGRASQAGEIYADYLIGEAYWTGRGLEANPAVAMGYLEKAVDGGVPEAQALLGQAYLTGSNVAMDVPKGLRLTEKAADAGDASANAALAEYMLKSTASDMVAQAPSRLEKSAKAGNPWAWLRLGELYSEGRLIPADPVQAREAFEKAVAGGVAPARIRLAEALIRGTGGRMDIRRGIEMAEAAADDADPSLLLDLCRVLIQMPDAAREGPHIVKLLRSAADRGNGWAAFQLGVILDEGKLVKPDPVAAVDALRRASASGIGIAGFKLGEALILGRGTAQDKAAGIQLALAHMAEADSWAVLRLGSELAEKPENKAETEAALKLLEQAAGRGNGWAALTLADIYLTGKIVPEDRKTGFGYLIKADQAGIRQATFRVGEAMLAGDDIAQDIQGGLEKVKESADTAGGWDLLRVAGLLEKLPARKVRPEDRIVLIRAAAAKDNALAWYQLGAMSLTGDGVRQNGSDARTYFEKARALGSHEAIVSLMTGHLTGQFGAASDTEQGLRLLTTLEAKANPADAVAISDMYYWGVRVPRDPQRALSILRRAADKGRADAVRRLIEINRDAPGDIITRSVRKAEKVLAQYGAALDEPLRQREEFLLLAVRARTPGAFPPVVAAYRELRANTRITALRSLNRANLNAFIYIFQSEMKSRGKFNGEPDGMMNRATISLLLRACSAALEPAECRRGPLLPTNIRAIVTELVTPAS